MTIKSEKRVERKARKIVSRGRGRWLSNVSMADASRIKKTFPGVIEGEPQATERSSIQELVKQGFVGLYEEKK